jgi:hypothetical protein
VPRRPEPVHKRLEQLLVRLTAEELDWLESAAHLERLTANAYVYRLLQAHVSSLASNEHVRADVENRRAYDEAGRETIRLPAREAPAP